MLLTDGKNIKFLLMYYKMSFNLNTSTNVETNIKENSYNAYNPVLFTSQDFS